MASTDNGVLYGARVPHYAAELEDEARAHGLTSEDPLHSFESALDISHHKAIVTRNRMRRRVGDPRGYRPGIAAVDFPREAPAIPHTVRQLKPPSAEAEALPELDEPIEELIARRVATSQRANMRSKAEAVRTLRINVPGPIGLVHFGDPHIDDDGCDWAELQEWLAVCDDPAVLAGNIGDTLNVWIGGLMKKWAHQGTTEDEGIRLLRWLLSRTEWAYVVLGNHDLWRSYGYIMQEIKRTADVRIMRPHGVRLRLELPGTDWTPRIWARHDFPGRSWYHPTHGPNKAAMLDQWADILIAGHIHSRGRIEGEYPGGRPYWALRLRGFKRHDEYAEKLGHREHEHGAACMTILDPDAPPTERVRVIWDPTEAAATLKWLRKRRGY